MKLIQAIIRKEKLNDVLETLFENGIHGITVTNVIGHGGEAEKIQTYRGTTVKIGLIEKIKIEIVVSSDDFENNCLEAILNSARTGEVGDGKIFVLPIEKAYRIRTGEQDFEAVTPVIEL